MTQRSKDPKTRRSKDPLHRQVRDASTSASCFVDGRRLILQTRCSKQLTTRDTAMCGVCFVVVVTCFSSEMVCYYVVSYTSYISYTHTRYSDRERTAVAHSPAQHETKKHKKEKEKKRACSLVFMSTRVREC